MKIDAQYVAVMKVAEIDLPDVECAIPMYATCDSRALSGANVLADRLGMRLIGVLDVAGNPV